jgi:hypothetical protein
MNIERLARTILGPFLVEHLGTERGIRIKGAIDILATKGALSYGGWKPKEGDWYRVKGGSEKAPKVYEVSDSNCTCADHYFRNQSLVCAHREAIRAFAKAQKLLPHYQAFQKEGIELSL